jgi:hypothetical protein
MYIEDKLFTLLFNQVKKYVLERGGPKSLAANGQASSCGEALEAFHKPAMMALGGHDVWRGSGH